MSTNLPGVQNARNSLGRIAQAARARAQEVQEALAHLDEAEENVRIGAAAVLQGIDNERTPLADEGEQLLNILGVGQHQQAQASQPVPADPQPSIVEQTTTPVTELATPAPAQENPVTEQQQPADPQPATPATQRIPAIQRPEWGKGTRIGAYIGLLVSFLIAVNSRDWMADLADLTTGFGEWAIKAAWILALPAFGFYATGYIISAIIDRTRPNNPQQA